MRPQTDPQTRVTIIHLASSTTHAKCNKRRYYKEFNFDHRGKVKSVDEHKNPLKSQPLQISTEYGTIPNLAETFAKLQVYTAYCISSHVANFLILDDFLDNLKRRELRLLVMVSNWQVFILPSFKCLRGRSGINRLRRMSTRRCPRGLTGLRKAKENTLHSLLEGALHHF